MTKKPADPAHTAESEFAAEVGQKAARKLQAQQHPAPGVWFGLGMMGLIGWSVVVPTLLGAALGTWLDARHAGAQLDARHAGTHSWTLALLVAGLTLGCLNAWRWVANEDADMHEGSEHDHE